MKLYLINKNPIISKLVALSVSKLGVEMEEAQEIDSSLSAQIVLIDDECFEKELFDAYKTANPETKFCLFYAKSTERLEGFDEYIQKPFLPTDLVKTLSKVSGITPMDHQQAHKESDNSEISELEGAESLDLDDELDLSSFDDLQLDDEESVADSNVGGDEQLDFGAEEGIEEAAEDPNAPLDFGAEEGEESATENPDEQLDFGAEDDSGEEQDLNVLDKSDVDEIKDLLSNEEETPKQADESESLEKAIGDFEVKDDLDFSDLQAELDNIEVAEESKEEEIESKEENIPPLEVENTEASEDSKAEDFDFSLDEIGESIDDKPEESSESMENMVAEESKEGNEELDLTEALEDSTQSEIGEEVESLGETPSEELKEESLDLDLSDHLPTEETSETKEDLDSLGDLGEEADFNDLSGEEAESQIPLDIGLGDESQDAMQEEPNLAEEEGLKIPEDTELENKEDLSLDEEGLNAGEVESQMPMSDAPNTDEFDTLSLEGMSEALGEPIAKAPNPAPIVPNASVADSALPSNIQANSLESLITALQALQAQNLKDLLSGATISINIQFPKKD
ncbi:hypothetical protein [Helicobacter rodentium]|uniref:hypothetical protein n=1 Tax=Helicobacter rodentium TaxID=59617 RepID=UPI00047E6D21|nr:hypothetical protein [Helicobacter rodentium]